MERAGSDEEDVIGPDHPVSRVDRRALDDREDVALHALARDVGPLARLATGDLVDLVEKDDSVRLGPLDRDARDLVHVDQLVLLLLDEVLEGLLDRKAAHSRLAAEQVREDVLQVDVHLLDALRREDLEVARRASLCHLDLDDARVEPPLAELLTELLARSLELFERAGSVVVAVARHLFRWREQ